jgi:hypothetical protein
MTINPQLLALAVTLAPTVIDLFKSAFVRANPDAPVPTDGEVIAAFNSAFVKSLAVDEQWLAAHPVTPAPAVNPENIVWGT